MSMALDSLDHSMPPISGPGTHSHHNLNLGYRANGINAQSRKNKKVLQIQQYSNDVKHTIENHRRQRMKENLNKITEIYAKKPVKANPIGSSKIIEPIYGDTLDDRVQLPELNKPSIGQIVPEYSGVGTRSNSTVNQNPHYSTVGKS